MNGNSRLPGLDLLRALAVMMVLVFHFAIESQDTMFSSFAKYGWMGVDLFFVLSGYLIGSQLLRAVARGQAIEFRKFYLRRALRTLPSFLWFLRFMSSLARFASAP